MPTPEHLPPFTPFRRDLARIFTHPLLGAEVIHDQESRGLFKFEGEILKGKGGVIVHRHFSDADPEVVFHSLVIPSPVLIERELVSAIQLDFDFPGMMWLGRILGVKLSPIATRKTSSLGRWEQMARRLRDYDSFLHQTALPTIKKGNILLIQPEGGKAKSLERFKGSAVGRLLKAAQDEGLEDFPILFVDVRLAGTDGIYKKELGLVNLGGYELRVGNCKNASHVLKEADGNWRLVDDMVVLPEMQHAAAIQRT